MCLRDLHDLISDQKHLQSSAVHNARAHVVRQHVNCTAFANMSAPHLSEDTTLERRARLAFSKTRRQSSHTLLRKALESRWKPDKEKDLSTGTRPNYKSSFSSLSLSNNALGKKERNITTVRSSSVFVRQHSNARACRKKGSKLHFF